MADEPMERRYSRDENNASESSDDEAAASNPPKRQKISWQETLLSVIATQQEQLAQLSQRTNVQPTPSPATPASHAASGHASSSLLASFRLAEFNPDTNSYSIEEWLEDASKLKEELNVPDSLMIVKAGEALRERAHRFYCNWRPLLRTWDNFCEDLIGAFPDLETPGARAYTAATLRSRDCPSLNDYVTRKLRAVRRFHSGLPWCTILSMVDYGLDHSEAQISIRVQKPKTERALLRLLNEYDARRLQRSQWSSQAANAGVATANRQEYVFSRRALKQVCFSCRQRGHRFAECPALTGGKSGSPQGLVGQEDRREEDARPTCVYCRKLGHRVENCRFKRRQSVLQTVTGHAPAALQREGDPTLPATWQVLGDGPATDKAVDRDNAVEEDARPTCVYCRKLGHLVENCWFKHGKSVVQTVTGHAPAARKREEDPRLAATRQVLGDGPATDKVVDRDNAVEEAGGGTTAEATPRAQHSNATLCSTNLFQIGDQVAITDSQLAGDGEVKPKLEGPYTVRTVLPNERYVLDERGHRTTVVARREQLRRLST